MFRNQKGVTLIELLAVIGLLSVIMMLVGSIYLFTQKQFLTQTAKIEQQSNVRGALTELTKDIRSVKQESIKYEEAVLHVGPNQYYWEKDSLIKNEAVIADSITNFQVVFDAEQIEISISSKTSEFAQEETISTVVMFRR
ncbi:prepilin-type N-terminal cleavage/methylation domain-containing protein [Gracilibacillus sp. YIM 98692]|uniref:PilW family protein n=1 Tax=Gracilibacillus sp. YIM 98692 TaxID=2663532 RepID=UPI0013D5F27B|nr:prepilin-type N-terminal cleavage/methylation domain-containing protein [Gracilibacillus sp. YIM 98692]